MTTLAGKINESSPSALIAENNLLRNDSRHDELVSLRADHARLQQAVFEAAQVQRMLCMPRELSWRQYEIAGEIFPVRHLSGDFFKVMKSRSRLALVLGDIAGKGLSAGIWQTHVMGLIQRSARKHSDPARVLAEVNRQLCRGEGQPPLTAMFFARINPQSNELSYCNAGLPAPLLIRDNNTLERLDVGGPMLGAVRDGVFHTGKVILNPCDLLVACSDGVTECRNSDDQEFELDRLAAAARAVAGISATQALFSLLGAVLDFAESCSPGDDVTLLVLRRQGANRTQRLGSQRKNSRPSGGRLQLGGSSPPVGAV
ncbi:MAG TPA: PP2C family protein-serine/threonine phosphatase [Candidatus Eisenbacteria bacterium]|nr:PP2C family protein-serine/threonine phosphatase [Candidatus Eisenbacteria bacterium]